MKREPRMERRRSYRIRPRSALARCRTDHSVGDYSVRDLSLGGVLLEGEELPVGSEIELVLVLPERGALPVEGRVVRNDRAAFAVAFEDLRDEAEEAIEDEITSQLIAERSPVALVADSCSGECKALARSLNALGYRVIGVSTPLEVITHLQDPRLAIDTVVLGTHLGRIEWLEMASYLSDEYPQLRRVLVARPSWRKRREARGLVHAVVRKPWTPDVLADALHARTVN